MLAAQSGVNVQELHTPTDRLLIFTASLNRTSANEQSRINFHY